LQDADARAPLPVFFATLLPSMRISHETAELLFW
jgi:hypothetical protein